VAILEHEAERLAVVAAGFEAQAAGLQSVGDLDGADLAGVGKEIGDSDGPQHAHRRGRDGTGPAVERGALARFGVGGVDDDRRKPARIERGGQRKADHPSTEDDDVGAIHAQGLNRTGSSLRAKRSNPVSLFALDCRVAFGSSQ
jgi:hypothetical protein